MLRCAKKSADKGVGRDIFSEVGRGLSPGGHVPEVMGGRRRAHGQIQDLRLGTWSGGTIWTMGEPLLGSKTHHHVVAKSYRGGADTRISGERDGKRYLRVEGGVPSIFEAQG